MIDASKIVTAEQRENKRLNELRSNASLSKGDFLTRAVSGGMIGQAAAIAAAKGEVPPEFASIISMLPAFEKLVVELKWAGDGEISRINPLITTFASLLYGNNSDSILDQLFGIE